MLRSPGGAVRSRGAGTGGPGGVVLWLAPGPGLACCRDIRWLLERQVEVLPKHPSVHDFSNLMGRRRPKPGQRPQVGVAVDNAWRAVALMVDDLEELDQVLGAAIRDIATAHTVKSAQTDAA